MSVAYLNKRFIPLNKANISILDRGFLYGDGVFETMRSYNGAVFRLEKHTSRLFKSLKALGIRPPAPKKEIEKKVYKLLRKNKLSGDAYIKIIVTRGKAKGLLLLRGKSRPTLAIYALAYRAPSRGVYAKGIKVSLFRTGCNRNYRIARHKTLNYLPNVLWRYEAEQKGSSEAILINANGMLSEATSSSIFLVKGEKLYTPSLRCGILPGITREEVIHLAEKILKIKVRQIFMKKSFLYNASEIFLTNSLAEIMPVRKIDNYTVGKGTPGPLTKRLIGAYKHVVKG